MNSIGINLATDETGDDPALPFGEQTFQGGRCAFITSATDYASGSVKLQVKTRSDAYVDLATHSADSYTVLDLVPGTYRVLIDSSENVYADLVRVPA